MSKRFPGLFLLSALAMPAVVQAQPVPGGRANLIVQAAAQEEGAIARAIAE